MTDQTQPSRRTLLRFAAAGGTSVAISGVLGAPWASAAPRKSSRRVYVLVTDGLRPDEITADCTPTSTPCAAVAPGTPMPGRCRSWRPSPTT